MVKGKISKKLFMNLSKEFKHAFYIEKPSDLNKNVCDSEDEFMKRLADGILNRKMAVPAILFLETYRPLNFIGNQIMTFFRPFASTVYPKHKYDKILTALENRGNIDKLIKLLEKERN